MGKAVDVVLQDKPSFIPAVFSCRVNGRNPFNGIKFYTAEILFDHIERISIVYTLSDAPSKSNRALVNWLAGPLIPHL